MVDVLLHLEEYSIHGGLLHMEVIFGDVLDALTDDMETLLR